MYADVFVCGVKLKYSDIYDRFGCIDVHEQYSVVGNVFLYRMSIIFMSSIWEYFKFSLNTQMNTKCLYPMRPASDIPIYFLFLMVFSLQMGIYSSLYSLWKLFKEKFNQSFHLDNMQRSNIRMLLSRAFLRGFSDEKGLSAWQNCATYILLCRKWSNSHLQ